MDLGPTVLEAAGVDVPTYLEGTTLQPHLDAPEAGFEPRRHVYCEDNFQIMMRSNSHKLVYYIGQEEGELYDLQSDPHELWNLWGAPEHVARKDEMLVHLLCWLAASNYYNAGYKRTRAQQYKMRWPTAKDPSLQGQPQTTRPIEL